MRSFSAVVVLLLVLAPGVLAQDVTPDTLDWHGYYPLEVGNAWESFFEGGPFWQYYADRSEIVADSLANGKLYFVQQNIRSGFEMGIRFAFADTAMLRYDDANSRVVSRRNDGSEYPLTCDLAPDFGSTLPCNGPLIQAGMVVSGEYAEEGACIGVGQSCAPYAARKILSFPQLGTSVTYYHGIMVARDEGLTGPPVFTYLRVGGNEYGERLVYLDIEETPDRADLDLSVYPNPARDRAWLTLPVPARHLEVTMYDLLGRTVQAGQACTGSPCELELDALSPGLYFVRVAEGSRMAGVVPVVVSR